MAGYLDKIIIITLCFVLLLFVPIVVTSQINDMALYRTLLNESENFIDLIIDKGDFEEKDLEDLYLATAVFGTPMNVEVFHYQRILNPINDQGRVTIGYRMVTPTEYRWQEGDKVQVIIRVLELTRGQRFKRQLLGFGSQPYEVSAAGRIRRARDISFGS